MLARPTVARRGPLDKDLSDSQGFADQNNLKTKEVPQKPQRVQTISKAVLMNIEPDQSHHRSGLTAV